MPRPSGLTRKPAFRSTLQGAALAVGLLAAHLLLEAFVGLDTGEGGPIEQMQILLLLLGAGFWLRLATGPADAPGRWRALAPLFAAGCLTGVGRELSWGRVWGAPDQVETTLQALNGAVLLAALVTAGLRLLRARSRPAALGDSPGALLAVAVAVFAVSDLFEKRLPNVQSPQLWEEALELAAFALLVLAAYVARPPGHAAA